VLAEMTYTHPVMDQRAFDAQRAIADLNAAGVRHTFYCGAHLGYGFHEDGLVSALAVVRRLGGEW
jgi:predicted NAD/FAD-binding protein